MADYSLNVPERQVRVWDPAVRLFHWSLVATVTLSYVFIDPRALHRGLGYVVLALVAFRLVWGVVGPPNARFSGFVPGPAALLRYLNDMVHGRETRFLGHNPAGAAMIVVLLLLLSAICATGYMMGMDAFFGQTWVEELHEGFVNLLLICVAGHLGGVLFSSWRHRENLILSMITGRKHLDDQNPKA